MIILISDRQISMQPTFKSLHPKNNESNLIYFQAQPTYFINLINLFDLFDFLGRVCCKNLNLFEIERKYIYLSLDHRFESASPWRPHCINISYIFSWLGEHLMEQNQRPSSKWPLNL